MTEVLERRLEPSQQSAIPFALHARNAECGEIGTGMIQTKTRRARLGARDARRMRLTASREDADSRRARFYHRTELAKVASSLKLLLSSVLRCLRNCA